RPSDRKPKPRISIESETAVTSLGAQNQNGARRKELFSAARRAIATVRARAAIRLAASLLVAVTLIGCGSREVEPRREPDRGTPAGAPLLKAEPNLVPKANKMGKTTITWNTGDGSWGQVYVSENGGMEKLFMQERSGSKEVAWIGKKGTYEFRLYAGSDHERLLASVTVTMEKCLADKSLSHHRHRLGTSFNRNDRT
ncbi:MAG: hypothetical protein WD648_08160, partial [Planctomycetaceae bacterium]